MPRKGKGSGAKTAHELRTLRDRKIQKRSNESENERTQSLEDDRARKKNKAHYK